MTKQDPDHVDTRLRRGMLHFRAGRYEQALADLDHAAELVPGNTDVGLERGRVLAALGRGGEALEQLGAVLEREPGRAEALRVRAGVYIAQQDEAGDEDAVADLDLALELEPEHAGARVLRGRVHERRGRAGLALDDYTVALERAPEDAETWFLRGRVLARGALGSAEGGALDDPGRVGEALADLGEALRLEPGHSAARWQRARLYIAAADAGAALVDLDVLLDAEPGHSAARVARARLRLESGRPGLAVADVDNALREGIAMREGIALRDGIAPRNDLEPAGRRQRPLRAEAHMVRAQSYAALGRPQLALADFAQTLELRLDDPEALLGSGAANEQLGNDGAALADYDALLGLQPDHRDGRLARGRLLVRLERDDEALADFDALLLATALPATALSATVSPASALSATVSPGTVSTAPSAGAAVLRARGALYLRQGRTAEALTDLERALVLEPDHGEALITRGEARLAQLDAFGAAADAQAAERLLPRDATRLRVRAALLQGTALARSAAHEAAMGAYTQALRLAPQHPAALLGRARSALASGQPEDALRDLESVPEEAAEYGQAMLLSGDAFLMLAEGPAACERWLLACELDVTEGCLRTASLPICRLEPEATDEAPPEPAAPTEGATEATRATEATTAEEAEEPSPPEDSPTVEPPAEPAAEPAPDAAPPIGSAEEEAAA